MYKRSIKLSDTHKALSHQLESLGWYQHSTGFPPTRRKDPTAALYSPHVQYDWLESCLRRINPDVPYPAFCSPSMDVAYLGWSTHADNPHNNNPMNPMEAFGIFRSYLLDGIHFDFGDGRPEHQGTINVVDWEHPERNAFGFIPCWRGAKNDGFGWDFILCVNSLPIGAILVGRTWQKALEEAREQLAADTQFQVYCQNIVVVGKNGMMTGEIGMPNDYFTAVTSVEEFLSPLEYLEKRVHQQIKLDDDCEGDWEWTEDDD